MSDLGYKGLNSVTYTTVHRNTSVGSIVHELGHALGLWHAHQRPDRDLYVNMYYRNWCGHPDVARIDTRAVPWSGFCASWDMNMGIQAGTTGNGPLDFNSIMMYGSSALRFLAAGGVNFDQPTSGSPYIGPDFYAVMPGLKPGYGYPTILRKGYDYDTDPEAYNWLGLDNGILSHQDIATLNSMYPDEQPRVGWIDIGTCSETTLKVIQEDENTGNNTYGTIWQNYTTNPALQTTPYTLSEGIYKSSGPTTRISICPQEVASLPVLRDDYAVLKLSSTCPLGSFGFSRTADNENTTNANDTLGDVSPSSISNGYPHNGSTNLHFCFVPGDGDVNPAAQPTPPWYTLKAGAFTRGNFSALDSSGCHYHAHVQDDEDTDNAFASGGNYDFETGSEQFESRIKWLFNNSQAETHYHWHECRP